MDREQVCSEVALILRGLLPDSGPVYGDNQNLQRDLGIDSTQFVQLVVAFEQRFNLQVSDTELLRLKTVGDCVDYVFRQKGW